MPNYDQQLIPAPSGMATAVDPASLPVDRARLLEGMFPSRMGVSKTAPIPKKLTKLAPLNAGEQIQGYAIYRPQSLFLSSIVDLLIFTDRNLYILPIGGSPLAFATRDYAKFVYDDGLGRQRGHIAYTALAGPQNAPSVTWPGDGTGVSNATDWTANLAANTINNVASVQFDNELLFCGPYFQGLTTTTNLWRYYRNALGDQFLYAVYIPGGNAPTAVYSAVNPRTPFQSFLFGTHYYAWTWVDELGRESSPSDVLTTPSLDNQTVTITRGTSAPNTATGGIAGWRLYRSVDGQTFNLVSALSGTDPLPVATTTFNDNAYPDTTVALQPVMPDFGENDPPDPATYLTVHKNRIVLNDINFLGVCQIGNAGSATQFSSITLPTNNNAGIRLSAGDAADNALTGIESIGDLLWLAKPSTYYLLQGDNISNWNLQEMYKNRGCDNFFTVQRCEEAVLFKSSDGVYELSYQAGMVSPKISWEIEDILNGFSGVLTPDEAQPYGGVFTPGATDGNTVGQPQASQSVGRYIDFVRSFYWQQRYFLCMTDRTLVLDMLSKGWGDAGWGPIKWPVVYQGIMPYNVTGVPSASMPDAVFFSRGGSYSGDLDVWYFTSVDGPHDVDIATTFPRPWVARVQTRDFDQAGNSQQRYKRGVFYSIFGTTGRRPGTKLGELRFYSGDRLVCPPVPILAGIRSRKWNALFEQALPSTVVGEELWAEERWFTSDIQITNRLLESVPVGG